MRPSPAVKVAAVATAVLAVVYVAAVIVLNLLVGAHLTGQSEARLADRLSDARRDPSQLTRPASGPGGRGETDDLDADSAAVYLWAVNAGGTVTGHSPGALSLPASLFGNGTARGGLALTAGLGSRDEQFRLKLARDGSGWLVAGQSVAGDAHTQNLLRNAELIAGPFLLAAMFLGSLVVGLRAQAPVEQSRRRQLEFTADASHELRTPLSVIRAEADVALSAPRDADGYRDALRRIQGETGRLRQLVEDMLWLARFDSQPPPPGDEPVDLGTLAQACADRFRSVGPAVTAGTPDTPVLISAPPEWIDRLAGVLVDNACRYAGPGGQVRIGVLAEGSRVTMTVEDSGPGIPAAERSRLFDRFHRATEHGSGAGLGLAIGDSIVRSTGGRWHVGDSALGGAQMSVSWRHAQPRAARPVEPSAERDGVSPLRGEAT
ncbi:MAG: HAMP domain-containing sensor histidine kinase [Streptosporangiaceae bacterium]